MFCLTFKFKQIVYLNLRSFNQLTVCLINSNIEATTIFLMLLCCSCCEKKTAHKIINRFYLTTCLAVENFWAQNHKRKILANTHISAKKKNNKKFTHNNSKKITLQQCKENIEEKTLDFFLAQNFEFALGYDIIGIMWKFYLIATCNSMWVLLLSIG